MPILIFFVKAQSFQLLLQTREMFLLFHVAK